VLLVGAGLFVRSLHNAQTIDLGFTADRVIVSSIDLGRAGYTPERQEEFYARAVERVRALPGVSHASVGVSAPFTFTIGGPVRAPGVDTTADGRPPGAYYNFVDRDFFATLGTPLLRGRVFADADGETGQQVAIVSARMARTLWPGRDAVGNCFYAGRDSACTTVVGVVADARQQSIDEDETLQYYRPLAQHGRLRPSTLFIRASGEPGPLMLSVRRERGGPLGRLAAARRVGQ
jgi:hypothetical protein